MKTANRLGNILNRLVMDRRNWWLPLAVVMTIGLGSMIFVGTKTYDDAPPIPDFVDAAGRPVTTQEAILRGARRGGGDRPLPRRHPPSRHGTGGGFLAGPLAGLYRGHRVPDADLGAGGRRRPVRAGRRAAHRMVPARAVRLKTAAVQPQQEMVAKEGEILAK